MRIKTYYLGRTLKNVIVCIILNYNSGLCFPIFLRKNTPNAFLDILNGVFFLNTVLYSSINKIREPLHILLRGLNMIKTQVLNEIDVVQNHSTSFIVKKPVAWLFREFFL